MDDLEIFSLGKMTNSSRAMFERRRRILYEARKIIGEKGLEGFSVRELCDRAGVASRTLYNAFESKEHVVALAIREYFEAFNRTVKFSADPHSFEGAIEHQLATTLRDLEIPNYLHAIAAIYFSPSLDLKIREVLLDIGTRSWRPWLEVVAMQRQLQKGVAVEHLLTDISNLLFAKVHEWGLGEIDDDAFVDRTIDGLLTMLRGATKGAANASVRNFTRLYKGDAAARSAIIAEAQARIAFSPATPSA